MAAPVAPRRFASRETEGAADAWIVFAAPAGSRSQLTRIGHETVTRWSGRIKELTGSLLHDDKLRAEGRLERAAAAAEDLRRRARKMDEG